MEKNCLNCGEIFTKKPSDSKKYWAVKKYCSISCSGTTFKKGHKIDKKTLDILRSKTGSLNHSWKGGRYRMAKGYIAIWTGSNTRQYEHRYIMEKHIGRKLLTSEHVHHLNGDKTDNRLENLRLISATEHGAAHARQRWHDETVSNL